LVYRLLQRFFNGAFDVQSNYQSKKNDKTRIWNLMNNIYLLSMFALAPVSSSSFSFLVNWGIVSSAEALHYAELAQDEVLNLHRRLDPACFAPNVTETFTTSRIKRSKFDDDDDVSPGSSMSQLCPLERHKNAIKAFVTRPFSRVV
jgi:hypothetical protein